MTALQHVVVVGASLSGLRAAEALREAGHEGSVTVVGAEPEQPYDRPPLSKAYLTGEAPLESLHLTGFAELQARWLLGSPVVHVDTDSRVLQLQGGELLPYDGLVLACGASPWVPTCVDMTLQGTHLLRTAADALRLREALRRRPRRVVVLGGGFIGGELASTCHELGVPVSVVDPAPLPLTRPLGTAVAQVLADRHQRGGTDLHLGVVIDEVLGERSVEGVRLSDGSTLEADVLLVAVGVKPNTSWLQGSGIAVDDGVLCGPDLASTTARDVVACGDVARWTHPRYGVSCRVEHWQNAVESGLAAARTLLGQGEPFAVIPSFWSDQLGLKIQGVGLLGVADEVVVDDPGDGTGFGLLATYFRAGELVGAVAFGGPKRLLKIRRELNAAPHAA